MLCIKSSNSLPIQDRYELVLTDDGSHTIVSDRFKVPYHSRHGAISESHHVFIQAGLTAISPEKDIIRILEMGFGTGLNPLLVALYAQHHQGSFHYSGIEKFPIPQDFAHTLNYPKILNLSPVEIDIFQQLHLADQGQFRFSKSQFSFEKIYRDFNEMDLGEANFDLIFFDAFAPNSQEELWTLRVMERCYKACTSGGILVTYCAKGQLRRDMQEAGFIVERLPGPAGKREMLRAIKP